MTELHYSQSEDLRGPVYCLGGIPVNFLSLADTLKCVLDAVERSSPLFYSTPNLNFLITSLRDTSFREALLRSDLSTADGMPLVWIARLLGVALPERVAGSSLVEALATKAGRPLRLFFFGGEDGVAEAACARLNAGDQGWLQCAGHHNPGFGTVEDMSSPDVIHSINVSDADFLIVALGAAKGQAWLLHNREGLTVPVVSHLGAVVNFIAGSVNRAPPLLQRSGLEWAWRVKEEPKLWRRYFSDGLALLRLLATQILPYALWLRLNRTRAAIPLHAELGSKGEAVALVLTGACSATNSRQLLVAVDEALAAAGDNGTGTDCGADIALDMRGVTYLDPRALGILLMLEARLLRSENVLLITDLAPDLHKVLRWNGMYQLFCARKQP